MNLSRLAAALRFVGSGGILRAVQYSLIKTLAERQSLRGPTPASYESPGSLLHAAAAAGGGQFRFQHRQLEVQFLAPDLVRVTWGPATLPLPYGLAKVAWPEVPVTWEGDAGLWKVGTGALQVDVFEDGGIRFLDPGGRTLRTEQPPRWRDNDVVHEAGLRPEEHLYGLGNRATSCNRRGRRYRMWNRDPGSGFAPGEDPLYLCIPAYLGVHGDGSYLIFYENSYPAMFDFSEHAVARFEGGALRYYVMPGPPARAIERYTELTGRPPLPPRWGLGYHQSRWSYGNAAEVEAVVAGFARHQLPLAAVYLDIDYMERFKVFTVDARRFPDLAGLARKLAAQEIHLVAILDPGVKVERGYRVFDGGEAERVFCALPNGARADAPVWPGWCAFPDFTDPRARRWWKQQYPALLDLGIDGVWHDMNEPAAFAAWGDQTLPSTTRHAVDGRGGDHREAHNLYALLENQTGYEAMRASRPDRRPFIVSRSGWAGVQRYAWNWTGDVASTWPALRHTVATVLGLGLSGLPFTGSDVGGFGGAPTAELYLRWLQCAAFFPFFRTHSAKFTPRREPWQFGEPYLGLAREALNLRYRLLPYLYTLAWDASQSGSPLVRPLFWRDPHDSALWDVEDAFLLGDALLIAPVLAPGCHAREVVLPEGTWYEFPGDHLHRGPARVSVAVSLERIPVMARGGSVLPMEDDPTGRAQPGLLLHVFPPQEGEGGGFLYSDAGDGYGPWRVDRLRMHREHGQFRVWWSSEGTFVFPYASVRVQLHGLKFRQATVDGTETPSTDNIIVTGRFAEMLVDTKEGYS